MDKKEISKTIKEELLKRGLTDEELNRILYNNDPLNKISQQQTEGKKLNLVIKT